jgi:hypothetical protein
MRKEQNTNETATARAMHVLVREARRTAESAERVRLVVDAMALRYGVGPTETGDQLVDCPE